MTEPAPTDDQRPDEVSDRDEPAAASLGDETLPSAWGRWPRRGRLLGVDYGQKRVGLALCNDERTLATPIDQFVRGTEPMDRASYRRLLEHWGPRAVVVGLPLHADGRESAMSREAREHAAWLFEHFGLPCRMWDERFTSIEAEAALYEQDATKQQRKNRVDGIAACFMLQAYLEHPAGERRRDDQDASAAR